MHFARRTSTTSSRIQTYNATDRTFDPHSSGEANSGQKRSPLLSIIVPTRNEQANVGPLMARLSEGLVGWDYEVVFVDDSDDETPVLLGRMQAETDGLVRLHHRPKGMRAEGLSGAVIEGLRLASGEYVAVMDADLQHPPELLPVMLSRAVASKTDVVVASRYVPGGSAQGLGKPSRQIISQAVRWFSRILFHERIWRLQDPGSGFFIVRGEMLKGVELKPIGYKILIEILMRCSWDTMEEVPYRFENRAGGESKATLKQGLMFLRHALRIFTDSPTAGRLWKFLLVGGLGTVINLSLLWVAGVELGLPEIAAWLIALEASLLSNCALNRSFAWRDRRSPGLSGLLKDVTRYHIAVGGGLIASTLTFWCLRLVNAPLIVSGLAGIVVGSGMNYLGCDNLVFLARRGRLFGKPVSAIAPGTTTES